MDLGENIMDPQMRVCQKEREEEHIRLYAKLGIGSKRLGRPAS